MHIDTYRQHFQTLQRCSFIGDDHCGRPVRPGTIKLIDQFPGYGVCAQVFFSDSPWDYAWYQYDGTSVTKMLLGPITKGSGIIPPGCSL